MSGHVVKSPDTKKDANPKSPIAPPCHPRRFTRKPKTNFKQYEDLTTRKIKQAELRNEIQQLQDEINDLYASFDQMKENEQEEYEKTYVFNSKFYPDKNKVNTEDNDYFSKILCLEDEHFELTQQISFFTTFYSDKNIKK
ncbi:hypothetical protein TVAG_015310 [Trichomonas vaginalis G3]|uniref:Uncharacterized protein n=1 Tax=Trichomonas vaginalis (strain ATCC PRA-98 / G3) TaxID=412133 RepID=A2G652_TRIV3|nr:hypothetical protein TVAGG3_0440190 [Trichomonas vaginalis G3]EAX87368.1 hypothetical protein TVAG_015310 [Trichomonas vaginalis G3]KAI5537400.1 hypothetical protein TVAGG3_0440190 [Trichomonas vaginalis G3]|eukprot:XP_001300298.1 hypothetical protein [Trichomonas vaginalis G3]